MKKILALCAALALSVVMVVPAAASADKSKGNVGTFHGAISGSIPAGEPTLISSLDWAAYTCGSVHETRVKGGLQDKQSCVLTLPLPAGQSLPTKKSVTYTGYTNLALSPITKTSLDGQPMYWASDYQYNVSGGTVWMWASAWSWTIKHNGSVSITSFYPADGAGCYGVWSGYCP